MPAANMLARDLPRLFKNWCTLRNFCHRRRIPATPRPVVAGDRPHEAGLGLTGAGVEQGAARLVAEQPQRRLKPIDQMIVPRLQLGSRGANPLCQRRALDPAAMTRQDLRSDRACGQ